MSGQGSPVRISLQALDAGGFWTHRMTCSTGTATRNAAHADSRASLHIRVLGELGLEPAGSPVAVAAWQRTHAKRLVRLVCSGPQLGLLACADRNDALVDGRSKTKNISEDDLRHHRLIGG